MDPMPERTECSPSMHVLTTALALPHRCVSDGSDAGGMLIAC